MAVKIEVNHGDKVSVNMNSGTLSCIDLLVDNGYYSNRSDFINQAVRELIRSHQSTIDRIVEEKKAKNVPLPIGSDSNLGVSTTRTSGGEGEQHSWVFGLSGLTARELAELRLEGKKVDVTGYGVFTIAEDCPEELLYEVVRSISVRGKVICSDSVRAHYGLKK